MPRTISAGYGLIPMHDHSDSAPATAAPRPFDFQLFVAIIAGAALLFGQAATMLPGLGGEGGSDQWTLGFGLFWVSLIAGSIFGVKAAWEAIRALRLDIDILMVVGAGLSAYIGHPAEGALLLFMFTLAGALEHRALGTARQAVARLGRLMPASAVVRDTTGGWRSCTPDELVPGNEILVKPGESVPADAVVLSGRSELDQSMLTGESLPRGVGPGEEVYAGTVNQSGSIEARVIRGIRHSSLQRVLELVIEAQERRQPMQRLIDRLSTPYTICVFAAALGTLAWFKFGAGMEWSKATYSAITLLIVGSPCALVIATPTATLCGLSRAAHSGLLIKGGDALERLASVRTVALDKTGTLTMGQIKVERVVAFGAGERELVSLATGVEGHSTHPIAKAILEYASSKGFPIIDAQDVANTPGKGLSGRVDSGEVRVGKPEYALEIAPAAVRDQAWEAARAARAGGDLCAVLGCAAGALVISLSDAIRPGAVDLVAQLHGAGVRRVAMLTGDHSVIAQKVAKLVRIDIVHAELLPEQKVHKLEELKKMPGAGKLALVGDGVNDAPALAIADVGLAMGGIGAGAALEAADVVVLHDDLARIPWAFALARRVRLVMACNLTFAVSVIVCLAVLALMQAVTLGWGVVGHEGSTLVVVGVSLTILWFKPPAAARG